MPRLFGREQEPDTEPEPEAQAEPDTDTDTDAKADAEPDTDTDTPPRRGGRKPKGTDTLGRFMEQLAGLEDTATVECVRYRPQGGTELVQKWALESFDPYEMQKIWGGGKYLLRVRDEDGSYLTQATVYIAGKPKHPDPDNNTDNRSTLDLVQGMRSEFGDILNQLRNPPREAHDTSAIELALSIVGAFQAAQQPYVEALLSKTKTGPDSAEMLDLFFKGMEAAREMSPPSDPMAAVASQLAVPLLSQLTAGHTPPGAQPMQPNPATQTEPRDNPRRPPWDILLSPWLHHLQSWAAKHKNPAFRAAFVVDEIPDEAVQILGEQLERGEAFLAEFFTLHPETKPFQEWYRQFWGAIAGNLSWEGDDTDDTAGDAGDPMVYESDEAVTEPES